MSLEHDYVGQSVGQLKQKKKRKKYMSIMHSTVDGPTTFPILRSHLPLPLRFPSSFIHS